MDKNRIINYVMETPGNTNPAVLNTLLDENNSNKFFVTLTLTSDSGGTMDKSNAEIAEAYNAGKTIYFAINFNGIDCIVQATLSAAFEGVQYPSFNAYGIDTSGTTIINLYVDPSDEESYTFTMNAVEIGGNGGAELLFVTVENDGSVLYDDTDGNINEQYDAGKKIIVNNHTFAWRQGGGEYYTYYCNYVEPSAGTNRMLAVSLSFSGTVINGGQGTYTKKEYDLSSLVVQ